MTSKGSCNLDELHIKVGLEKFYEETQDLIVCTGIKGLDQKTLGLSGITCIRGQPKTNKSTLCLQIASYYADNYGPVVFLDRENGRKRLQERLVSQMLRISGTETKLLCRDRNRMAQVEPKILCKPIYVVPTVDFEQCEKLINKAQDAHGKPVLFVLDSLNKLKMNLNQRRDSIDEWLCYIDELKCKYGTGLKTVFTSEKNYQGYSNPGLGGSKDSSEIEYTAESIWDLRLTNNSDRVILHVSADRDGPAGYELPLQKVYSDPKNNRSFCFLLEDAEPDFDFSE